MNNAVFKYLPEDINNHIFSFIPKDNSMKSPVADLLKVDINIGSSTRGPSKYPRNYESPSICRISYDSFTVKESNNFWFSRKWILMSHYDSNHIPYTFHNHYLFGDEANDIRYY